MTIPSNVGKITHLGNGAATSFSTGQMRIFSATDLRVFVVAADGTETEITLGTGSNNFAVPTDLSAERPQTASVTYPADLSTPLAVGEKIILKLASPITQDVALENMGGYNPATLEAALDKVTAGVIQVKEEVDRAVKVDISSSQTADELLTSISDSETNAAASATAAAASATAAATAETNAETAQAAAEAARDTALGAVGGVSVSVNDTTPSNLENKLLVGTGLTLSTQNDGGNETRTITPDIASQAEAEAGTATDKLMTPLRTAQALAAQLPAVGKVLQVVSATNTTAAIQTSTSTTFVAVTGGSISITPSNTANKVKVTFQMPIYVQTSGAQDIMAMRIKRNTTVVYQSQVVRTGSASGGTMRGGGWVNYTYIDAPSTTSSVTYSIEFNRSSGTGTAVVEAASSTDVRYAEAIEIDGA